MDEWLLVFITIAMIFILFSKLKNISLKQDKILKILKENNFEIKNLGLESFDLKKIKIPKKENFEENNLESFEKNKIKENERPVFVVGDEEIYTKKEKNKETVSLLKTEEKEYFFEENDEQKIKEKRKESEFNFGAKVVPAIGILSIVIGVGFFMKYAFDNNLISELGRVILGFASGIIFIIIGERLRKKFSNYSALLVGGGFVLLYLSAKFGAIYNLYSNEMLLAIMAIITAVAVAVAYKINSRLIGYVSIVGGFLTPFLSWSESPNEFIIFNYVLILLFGMLFLAWKRGWIELIWGSAIGTVLVYVATFSEHYTRGQFSIYWAYLLLFFLFFAIAPTLFYFSKNSKDKNKEILDNGNLILSIVSGVIFVVVSHSMFKDMNYFAVVTEGGYLVEKISNSIFENLYFITGLIPAIVYGVLAKISLKKMSDEKSLLEKDENVSAEWKKDVIFEYKKPVYVFIAVASFAVALIPAMQFSGKWISISWFIEALVLAFLYKKIKAESFLNISLVILALGFLRMIFVDNFEEIFKMIDEKVVSIFRPVLNERALVFVVAVLVLFSIAYIAHSKGKKWLSVVLGVLGNLTALAWIWIEFFDTAKARYISEDSAVVAISITFLIYASVLMFIGIYKKYFGFRILSLILFVFVILKSYLFDIWSLDAIYRIIAFIALGVITLFVGYYYNKHKEKVLDFIKGEDIK